MKTERKATTIDKTSETAKVTIAMKASIDGETTSGTFAFDISVKNIDKATVIVFTDFID